MSKLLFVLLSVWFLTVAFQQKQPAIPERDVPDGESAKPWTFWYWMHGAVTKKAITADLEAMKEAGLGGAYIFAIRDVPNPPLFEPSVKTMTPEWWGMVKHAAAEANRLGLKLGMNSCDGFTAAGGPWITPAMSMQKVVWADTLVSGGQEFQDLLPQPEKVRDYYEDIALFAFPAREGAGTSSYKTVPQVTSNIPGADAKLLAMKGNKKVIESSAPCWISYAFDLPFTCRSITIQTGWNNYQSNRLKLSVSDDGQHFRPICRLEPPRSGWLDLDANATHLIPTTTARFFKLAYDPEGSEPGAEDLDDAKWSPALKIRGIELSGECRIAQFEGKSGAIWRIGKRNTDQQITDNQCINPKQLIDIGKYLHQDGTLHWKVPAGKWVILRMGHTSTGHVNYVGGGGLGLECDKLSPEVVRLQFDRWFGEARRQIGKDLADKVLTRFHVDSWECGSQNWSPTLSKEFIRRRGYDLLPFLPVLAGIPVTDADYSERILADLRQTISESVVDNFYHIAAEEAHKVGCEFSAESIAPVMVSDGMAHFTEVDFPMGEFWLNSPSHDKPNDILDAVSAAHIYGKKIIQAESFTAIRFDWNEHPGMMKTLADRNFAIGINKLFFHVFTLNPWTDRKPGMTLDKVGTFFQRDQTWWKPGKGWISYLSNCQQFLQQGTPVVDIALFTGEDNPRRALLPDRLVDILPGIFGPQKVAMEKLRLQNNLQPIKDLPRGVKTQSNMADPADWIDPLNGYAYDSFNKDALLNLASVQDGNLLLPGGASYRILVVPGKSRMNPDGDRMSVEVAAKLLDLVNRGATLLINHLPSQTPGGISGKSDNQKLQRIIGELFSGAETICTDNSGGKVILRKKGKGRIIQGPYSLTSFDPLGLHKDFEANERNGNHADKIAWNHRRALDKEIYFIANQANTTRILDLSFRVNDKIPQIYHPVTGEFNSCQQWQTVDGRMNLSYCFAPNESLFVLFSDGEAAPKGGKNWMEPKVIQSVTTPWEVKFDADFGGPKHPVIFKDLADWSLHVNDSIRYYSGSAEYSTTFDWPGIQAKEMALWLDVGSVANMAEVILNGQSCGIVWTAPCRVRIDSVLKKGENLLRIIVTNTWANRLIGDHPLPENRRITRTTAPYRLEGMSLMPAGLLGPVTISKDAHLP